MQTLQKVLLAAFALFAALTALQQVQYGILCGKSSYTNQQEDPQARACQKRSALTAGLAAVCLLICLALGVYSKFA